ncbi:MAG: hypothetical protein IPG02_16275 [Ignavibacteria bacterium]|nr:hypothetical protein [Ignavibacteria bacterium]
MKPLELDIQKIKLESERKNDENFRFRPFLKGVNEKSLTSKFTSYMKISPEELTALPAAIVALQCILLLAVKK